MGVDFSVRVAYGCRVEGKNLKEEFIGFDEENGYYTYQGMRMITHGSYTSHKDGDVIIGNSLGLRVDHCSDNYSKLIEEPKDSHSIIAKGVSLLTSDNVEILDTGLYLVPDWS